MPALPLHPTIETNSIEFMKKIARSGQAITFLNPVDVAEEVQAGEFRHLPLHELESHPISLKLMVRARGGLDTFPSLVVEELRKAMPQLEPDRRCADPAAQSSETNGACTGDADELAGSMPCASRVCRRNRGLTLRLAWRMAFACNSGNGEPPCRDTHFSGPS